MPLALQQRIYPENSNLSQPETFIFSQLPQDSHFLATEISHRSWEFKTLSCKSLLQLLIYSHPNSGSCLTMNYPYISNRVYYSQILEGKRLKKIKVQTMVLSTRVSLGKRSGFHSISLLLDCKGLLYIRDLTLFEVSLPVFLCTVIVVVSSSPFKSRKSA